MPQKFSLAGTVFPSVKGRKVKQQKIELAILDQTKRGVFMSVIKWRESYNTGVEQFDREHHKIIELIDIMYEAVRDKSGREVTEKACNDILAYTVYHFANE